MGPPSLVTQLTPRRRLLRGIRAARLQLYKHSPITEHNIRLHIVNPGKTPGNVFVSPKIVSIDELRRVYEYEALFMLLGQW